MENNPNKDDSTNTDVVRAALNAYLAQDHAVAEQPLADDFVFTSPQDDHIGKAAYLDRCFPTADRLVSQQLLQLVDAGNGGVFVLYEYELKVGGRYRNAEFITVRGGQLIESQVFFGGRTS
jgi:ketosteroid isomerase-like protein